MTYIEAVTAKRYQRRVKTRGFHGRITGYKGDGIFNIENEAGVISVPHRKIKRVK